MHRRNLFLFCLVALFGQSCQHDCPLDRHECGPFILPGYVIDEINCKCNCPESADIQYRSEIDGQMICVKSSSYPKEEFYVHDFINEVDGSYFPRALFRVGVLFDTIVSTTFKNKYPYQGRLFIYGGSFDRENGGSTLWTKGFQYAFYLRDQNRDQLFFDNLYLSGYGYWPSHDNKHPRLFRGSAIRTENALDWTLDIYNTNDEELIMNGIAIADTTVNIHMKRLF